MNGKATILQLLVIKNCFISGRHHWGVINNIEWGPVSRKEKSRGPVVEQLHFQQQQLPEGLLIKGSFECNIFYNCHLVQSSN